MEQIEINEYVLLKRKANNLMDKIKFIGTQMKGLERVIIDGAKNPNEFPSDTLKNANDLFESMREERSNLVKEHWALTCELKKQADLLNEHSDLAGFDEKRRKLNLEISYFEKSLKNPALNLEERQAAKLSLEQKKAELETLNAEYAEKSKKIIELVNSKSNEDPDEPDNTEAIKNLTDTINYLYDRIKKMKEIIPGYFYSDEAQYKALENQMEMYNVTDPELIQKMSVIEEEVKTAKELIDHPTRTKEEQDFYNKIAEILFKVAEKKEADKNYLYDNVTQANELLAQFKKLKTKDLAIIEIMHRLTSDIKKVIEKNKGPKAAKKYQKELSKAKIRPTYNGGVPTEEELEKLKNDLTSPGSSRIKSRRSATDKEKIATSYDKYAAKRAHSRATLMIVGAVMTGFAPTSLIGMGILAGCWISMARNGERELTTQDLLARFKKKDAGNNEKAKARYERKLDRQEARERRRAERRGIPFDTESDEIDNEETTHTRGGM